MLQTERADMVTLRLLVRAPRFYLTGSRSPAPDCLVNWQQDEPGGSAEGGSLCGWHEPCESRGSRTDL
jgi:hypothetical protein